ncbi:hypothetical protein BH10ACI1_BH10ACI1_28670 [soil metagenome]
MELWKIGCGGAIILFVVIFIGLLIIEKIAPVKEKKTIADVNPLTDWQSLENPKVDVKEWVKIELKSDPERYSVFGQVVQSEFFGSKTRSRLTFNQLWNKQEGDKNYFILDVCDEYQTPNKTGYSHRSCDFTIIGMRAPQMSLPFFTLFPKVKIPKYNGWRIAVTYTHDLILSDGVNLAQQKISDDIDDWGSNRLKLPSILPEAPLRQIDPPISFAPRPFNERHELYGKETERLRQFFDDEKLTALESMPQTFVDGGGELIFVYIPEHKPKLEDIDKYINEGIAIINAVSREPNNVGNIV